jgi:hypothetical protein
VVDSKWSVPTWNVRTERQSLQAADVKSPEELSASSGAGAALGTMVGDQSRRKAKVGFSGDGASGRQRIGLARQFAVHARRAGIGAVAQHREADPRQLVGERASGLVVMRATLDVERLAPQAAPPLAACR